MTGGACGVVHSTMRHAVVGKRIGLHTECHGCSGRDRTDRRCSTEGVTSLPRHMTMSIRPLRPGVTAPPPPTDAGYDRTPTGTAWTNKPPGTGGQTDHRSAYELHSQTGWKGNISRALTNINTKYYMPPPTLASEQFQ